MWVGIARTSSNHQVDDVRRKGSVSGRENERNPSLPLILHLLLDRLIPKTPSFYRILQNSHAIQEKSEIDQA